MNIRELLSGESKNVEYKVSRPEKSIKYMKTVIAFSNGTGGHIIFGIEDHTREIIGIPEDIIFQEMDAITNAISDSCEPVVIPDVYPQTIDGKTVIVAAISAGKQRPYYIKAEGIADGVYIRVSGTSRKADRTMSREMYYESEGRSYDSVIRPDLNISNDEIEKLCADMKKVAIDNCKNDVQRQSIKTVTKNILLNWGILAEAKDGSIHPTNAYTFLMGQDAFLSKIQCGMFKGTTRSVFLDKRDYEGPLWQQVEDAFQFVLRNIRLGAKIEGIYRKDIYELPPDSIRELIINAVMNCSFLQSSHVQVAVYDDRLEITSPGGLMPGVTIERMKEGYSQIRNRALAHAFSYMNLIEGWGTGIPKLIREMNEYGLKEPEFVDMEIALRINLYRPPVFTPDSVKSMSENSQEMRENIQTVRENAKECAKIYKSPKECAKTAKNPQEYKEVRENKTMRESAQKYNNARKPDLNAQEKMVVRYIKENGKITSSQLMTLLDVKKRRAQVILGKMVDAGVISREGGSRNSHYVIHEFSYTHRPN